MNLTLKNGCVQINGRSFIGRNIRIDENGMTVDGAIQNAVLDRIVNVTVVGDCDTIEVGSGNVTADRVHGDVKTGSGDIYIDSVGGSIQTGSGDVTCGAVSGSVRTGSGDIHHG